MEYITKNAEETKDLGRKIATDIVNFASGEGAVVIALIGDLGAGKTTFTQGFAEGLGIKKRLVSPTFIIVRRYELDGENFTNFYHSDVYRFDGNEKREMANLGMDDLMSDPENIVLIEWADKVKEHLPKQTKFIYFKNMDEDTRKVTYEG